MKKKIIVLTLIAFFGINLPSDARPHDNRGGNIHHRPAAHHKMPPPHHRGHHHSIIGFSINNRIMTPYGYWNSYYLTSPYSPYYYDYHRLNQPSFYFGVGF